jgi:membrane protein YdbS with pleckstrin-like domain
MLFLNTAIDTTQLPAAETLELQPLHTDYRKVLRLEWIITTFVLLLIAAALSWWIFRFRMLPSLGLFGAAGLILAFYRLQFEKSFPLAGYALRERDVVHRKGWIVQRIRIAPFRRIQNCTVLSGPLERKFKLASLTVYTAGSSGADLKIAGLKQEEAERLRQFILQQIHHEDEVL